MTHVTYEETLTRPAAAWGAVVSMALCVAVLIASEFMPVSLLTPIGSDLVMTEGQAGQAISISGLFAVVTSLFIAGITRSIDRKVVCHRSRSCWSLQASSSHLPRTTQS